MTTDTTPSATSIADNMRRFVAVGSRYYGGPVHPTTMIDASNVIPGYDAGPAPDDAYATVVSINASVSRTLYQAGPPARIWAEVHDRVSIQWLRTGALNKALNFTSWVYSPQAAQLALDLGLVVLGVTPLRDLSDLFSEQWEERASVDVGFGYTVDTNGAPEEFFIADGFSPSAIAFSTEESGGAFTIMYDPPAGAD